MDTKFVSQIDVGLVHTNNALAVDFMNIIRHSHTNIVISFHPTHSNVRVTFSTYHILYRSCVNSNKRRCYQRMRVRTHL